MAVRQVEDGKYLIAVYTEGQDDAFIITAFLTRRATWASRSKQVWPTFHGDFSLSIEMTVPGPAARADCLPLSERKGMPTMSLWYDANRVEFISKTIA